MTDPGTGRPGYAAARRPLRNAAVGNLALDALDLPAIPGSQLSFTKHLSLFGR